MAKPTFDQLDTMWTHYWEANCLNPSADYDPIAFITSHEWDFNSFVDEKTRRLYETLERQT